MDHRRHPRCDGSQLHRPPGTAYQRLAARRISSDHWVWQPGPWLLVDRSTGHIAALHLPDFDALVSEVVWFRDYGAYCGVAQTAKGGLYAVVAQIGARKAVIQKQIAPWPPKSSQHGRPETPCQPAQWQRQPMRVALQLTGGGDPITFDIVGGSSIIEEGDGEDQ